MHPHIVCTIGGQPSLIVEALQEDDNTVSERKLI